MSSPADRARTAEPPNSERTENGARPNGTAVPSRPAGNTPGLSRRRPTRQRREWLRIRGRIRPWQFLAIAVAVFVLVLGIWQWVTAEGLVGPLFLPGPSSVWNELVRTARQGLLWSDAKISIFRIMVGFGIATAMAIPLGILIGTYRVWEAALEPLVDFVRYMPVTAMVPLSIIWAGTGNMQKFLIIWIGTFFQQVLMIMDNVKRTPQEYLDVGRTLGMKDRRIVTRIVSRNAAPAIWDSMRITLGWSWTYLTLAELIAANSGLGYRITVAQRYFETNLIIGYLLVLGVLGLTFDQAMKFAGRRMFRWAEAE